MKQGKICTYLDSANFDYEELKRTRREISDEDPDNFPQMTDDEILEFCHECKTEEFKAFFENLSLGEYHNAPCIITGVTERGYERHDITPKYYDQLYDAVEKCVHDEDEYVIWQNDDHLEIDIIRDYDADHFEMWLLNERGKEAARKSNMPDLSKPCYIRKMENYLF